MGKQFGNLMKTRHVVSYYLSPFEQKMFPNISHRMVNTWRRFSSSFFRVTPQFVIAYMVYSWGNSYNKKLKRKNPADYENDV
ncbi:cytochrome b-c1 complex subunit 8 [Pantherophis guttatus]|uniref:Cytochrome b-c1 complex subunit 8 n=1 Tax=Pantherophis guttatus TaxID=94885 RepID=A0A6P9B5Y1_PANGU|nr:cytochrome b-c1 complex subunit 8 [Pantherophis guttatus]